MGHDRPPSTLMATRDDESRDSMIICGVMNQAAQANRMLGTGRPCRRPAHREQARIPASSASVKAIGLARMLLAFLAA
jgi:hypothetical protein